MKYDDIVPENWSCQTSGEFSKQLEVPQPNVVVLLVVYFKLLILAHQNMTKHAARDANYYIWQEGEPKVPTVILLTRKNFTSDSLHPKSYT